MARGRILKKADWEYVWKIWKQSGRICPLCKKQAAFVAGRGYVIDGNIPFHIDHIIPISKGGLTRRENLQIICSRCNLKKGNKWPVDA